MANSLPLNPSLENLRKQAKTLKSAWLEGDMKALQRIRAVHPQYANTTAENLRALKPRLTDCQLVLAREYGFASWPQLKVAVALAAKEVPSQFVELACLCYDDPHYDHRTFHTRANEMLSKNPWLAEASIWSAAAAGNTGAVASLLDGDPELVNRPGPHGWTPLICACYSRVAPIDPAHSTFEAAKLLLDRGADPNAHTMKANADERLDQTKRRFTPLTGIFGGGSTGFANQPPHPRWHELAELLLQRGADPADEEALLINPSASLKPLLQHGLRPSALARRQVGQQTGITTLMGRALNFASRQGDLSSVQLLLEHGANTAEMFDGNTPWERAMARGHLEIARLLEQAGAPTAQLTPVVRFTSFCLAGQEIAACTMLESEPELISQAPKNMVQRAVTTKRIQAVSLALKLGFDPNWIEDNAPIHQAGILAEHEDILRLLLQNGASLTLRDPWYDGTAIGWADFFDYTALRDKLLNESGICFFDALDFNRLDRIPDILARDPAALERPFANCITREANPADWQSPLTRMVAQGKTAAVRALLEQGPNTTVLGPDGRSLLQLARDNGFHEIEDLLQERPAN